MKIARVRSGIKNSNHGSALIAMLTILGIMFTLYVINAKTLRRFSQRVDALNRQQTNHLAAINK